MIYVILIGVPSCTSFVHILNIFLSFGINETTGQFLMNLHETLILRHAYCTGSYFTLLSKYVPSKSTARCKNPIIAH